ncbi:RagB/SusD family nutrient uptake outer membrane protein [Sinomicrobium sp. M5D2P9]
MKKINHIKQFFGIFLALSLCSSCENVLDVENNATVSEQAVFGSLSYTNSAVVGVYNQLIGDNAYGNRISCLYPQTADDFKTSGDYNCNDRRGIGMYGACSSNVELNNPFKQLYTGIERANLCIKYIPLSDLYENGTENEKEMMRIHYGEALTLRAQFYHELLRNWGDLPAQFIPSADMQDLFLPKTDRDEIYDQLLEDLELASSLLPWRTESPFQNIRVTKGTAKGLRARIALARGGYALRRETNRMERKPDYLDFYRIAMQECKEIMARRDQHDLNPDYESIFRYLHGQGSDPTGEIMFEVGAFGGNSKTDSKLAYYNGMVHNVNSRFGRGGGGIEATPTYFYEFDSIADVRRDVTLAVYEVDKESKASMVNASSFKDGKFRRSWTNITGTSQNLAVNWSLLRFADVLLMYAEADNEVNGAPSADAVNALKEVRQRAYAGSSDTGVVPADKQGFFEAVVKERLLEFGGEGIRKYDLIRWNLLHAKISETRDKLRQFMDGTGRYSNVPEYIYSIPEDYDATISSGEMIDRIEFYGGGTKQVFFFPTPAEAPEGDDYVRVSWRAAINEDLIDSERKGWAQYFQPDHKELFPLYDEVLQQNYNMTQDYGY